MKTKKKENHMLSLLEAAKFTLKLAEQQGWEPMAQDALRTAIAEEESQGVIK